METVIYSDNGFFAKKTTRKEIMKRAHELFKNNESGWTFADAMHVAWLEAKEIKEEW